MFASPHCGSNPYRHCGNAPGYGGMRSWSRGPSETSVTAAAQRFESLETDGTSARHMIAKQSAVEVEQSGFDSRRSFVNTAKKVVRDALSVMARDVGQAFQSLGFDGDAAGALIKGLIKPLVQALRNGVDFTAQIRMAAMQKTTVITPGGAAESLSVVAKSIDIAVNHDTGEISVKVQQIELQQDSALALGAPAGFQSLALPLVAGDGTETVTAADDDDPYALPSFADIIERILEKTQQQATGEGGAPGEPTPVVPAVEVILPSADAESGARRVEALRTRIRIDAAQRYRNDVGELITRLRIDARVAVLQVLAQSPGAVSELAAAPAGGGRALDVTA